MRLGKRSIQFLSLGSVLVLLAACGGGGGGGSSASPSASSPVPPAVGNTVRIESEAGQASAPRIATDSSGNATAVWVQDDSAGVAADIYASRYDAATGTWSAAVPIDNQALDAFDLEIAIDPVGNAIAVWCQRDSTHSSVYANRYDATTGQWDTARLIGNATGDAQQPQIAIDFAGNIMVVWEVYDSSSFTYSVYANRYNVTSGGGWGGARLIENEAGSASDTKIAVDSAGNAIAVWKQRVVPNTFVYANRYDASTGWGATGQSIEVGTGGLSSLQIAFDSSDNAIAVWSKSDGTRNNILFNRYDATNGWNATAEPVENESDDAVSSQIAIDSAGNAIAVWQQFDAAGTSHSIKTSRYDAVTHLWGAVAPIATSAEEISDFHLAVAPNDNAVLVWGQNADLWFHRYAAGSGWGPAEPVESNAGEINGPRVAIGANNSAIAVWSQDDGTGVSDIWANINP